MTCFLATIVIAIATTVGIPTSKMGCNGGWMDVYSTNTCECAQLSFRFSVVYKDKKDYNILIKGI